MKNLSWKKLNWQNKQEKVYFAKHENFIFFVRNINSKIDMSIFDNSKIENGGYKKIGGGQNLKSTTMGKKICQNFIN